MEIIGFLCGFVVCLAFRGLSSLLGRPQWLVYAYIAAVVVFAMSGLGDVIGWPVGWGVVAAVGMIAIFKFIGRERRRRRGEWVE